MRALLDQEQQACATQAIRFGQQIALLKADRDRMAVDRVRSQRQVLRIKDIVNAP